MKTWIILNKETGKILNSNGYSIPFKTKWNCNNYIHNKGLNKELHQPLEVKLNVGIL
ncbi:hypothetical protein PANI_CDS0082 [Maribacter phage Panino]